MFNLFTRSTPLSSPSHPRLPLPKFKIQVTTLQLHTSKVSTTTLTPNQDLSILVFIMASGLAPRLTSPSWCTTLSFNVMKTVAFCQALDHKPPFPLVVLRAPSLQTPASCLPLASDVTPLLSNKMVYLVWMGPPLPFTPSLTIHPSWTRPTILWV